MSDCKFCESLQNHKQIHEFLSKRDKPGEGLLYEYSVAIVIHSYLKGRKAQAGRSTDYRLRGLGYVLNYCPECGRKL